MKFLLVLLFACGFALSAHAQQATQELLTQAQRAYMRGDFEAARAGFEQVLAIDPRNEPARRFLRMIQVQEKKAGGGGKIERQLRELIIPRIEFRQATLGSALTYLRQEASRHDVQVSFVVRPDVDQMQTITLSLSNVPFTDTLRYIGELALVEFRIEPHAIVVSRQGAAVASPAPETTPADQ